MKKKDRQNEKKRDKETAKAKLNLMKIILMFDQQRLFESSDLRNFPSIDFIPIFVDLYIV